MWAGVAVGLAFLAKTLQAFLILPPLAVAVRGVRAGARCASGSASSAWPALAMVVAGGWWVAIVELWPASSRPYIGGSQNNSFLELTFGYNGLGRINGEETGSVGGGGVAAAGAAAVGRDRHRPDVQLRDRRPDLLAAARRADPAGRRASGLTWRATRTDTARAAFLAWGGSLLMTAPRLQLHGRASSTSTTRWPWRPTSRRWSAWAPRSCGRSAAKWWAGAVLGVTVAATAVWSYVLLGRTPDYLPWLRWAVLIGGLLAGRGAAARGAARAGARAARGGPGPRGVAGRAGGVHDQHGEHRAPGSIVTAGPSGASMGGPGRPPGRRPRRR